MGINLKNGYNGDLNKIDKIANTSIELITKQIAQAQGITGELKARDQTAWVRATENIRNAAEELVLTEHVYC